LSDSDDVDEDAEVQDDEDGELQTTNNDEVDPMVAASDNAVILEVAEEVGYSGRIPLLSREEVNVRRFSVFKVHTLTTSFTLVLTSRYVCISFDSLQQRLSIARLSRPTSKLVVPMPRSSQS
jgi:hypothetical protein